MADTSNSANTNVIIAFIGFSVEASQKFLAKT